MTTSPDLLAPTEPPAHRLLRRERSFHASCCPDRAFYWYCACGFMGYDDLEFEEHLENPEPEED